VVLRFADFQATEADASLFRAIGITGPFAPARVGAVRAGTAAQEAGLIDGDLVLQVDQVSIVDAAQLRALIRESGRSWHAAYAVLADRARWRRASTAVTPRLDSDEGERIGRIGAIIGDRPAMVVVRSGPLEGVVKAVEKTWDVSALTLAMMGKMLVGEASLKNLSGPITIADYAGRSAALGLTQYLVFLALNQCQLGRVEPATAAHLGRWAPDVLSLGGPDWPRDFRGLDVSPTTRGLGRIDGDDVGCLVQRHAPFDVLARSRLLAICPPPAHPPCSKFSQATPHPGRCNRAVFLPTCACFGAFCGARYPGGRIAAG